MEEREEGIGGIPTGKKAEGEAGQTGEAVDMADEGGNRLSSKEAGKFSLASLDCAILSPMHSDEERKAQARERERRGQEEEGTRDGRRGGRSTEQQGSTKVQFGELGLRQTVI